MQWRCDETGTQDNLWLNLSTGFIGSGRQVIPPPQTQHGLARSGLRLAADWHCSLARLVQQYGMEGGGSALRHYEATGRKYPLVVKLGTITPHGADVYSYAADEDDMVLDPLLAQHLSHWGINMVQVCVRLHPASQYGRVWVGGAGAGHAHAGEAAGGPSAPCPRLGSARCLVSAHVDGEDREVDG